jgi:hypothetical protein
METNTGIAQAVLHQANYLFMQMRQGKYKKPQSPYDNYLTPYYELTHFSTSLPRDNKMPGLFTALLETEPKESLAQEFVASQRRLKDEQAVVDFVVEHGRENELVDQIKFETTQQLLDANNPEAIMLWRNVLIDSRNQTDAELIQRAEKLTTTGIAQAICFGNSQTVRYADEKIDAKKDFIKALREAGEELKKNNESEPKTSGITFNRDFLGIVKQKIEQRVAVYQKTQPQTSDPSPETKVPREEQFTIHETLLNHGIQRISESALDPKVETPDGQTPLQNTLWRYFRMTGRILHETLSENALKERFGVPIKENPEAQYLILKGLYFGYFFDLPKHSLERIPNLSIEQIRSRAELIDYLRFIPSVRFMRYDIKARFPPGMEPDFSNFLTRSLTDHEKITKVDELAKHLELVRLTEHQPRLKALIDDSLLKLKLKKTLFGKYIQLGWKFTEPGAHGEPTQKELDARVKAALENRAKQKGLPPEFFWTREQELSAWQKVKTVLGDSAKLQTRWQQKQALNRIFNEEFMRTMADDPDEMKACQPDEKII